MLCLKKKLLSCIIKHSMKHSLQIFLIGWLCVFSMANPKALPGVVLCIGEDGHVELELAENERCSASEANGSAFSFESFLLDRDDHCGNCADIPMFCESTKSAIQQTRAVLQPAFQTTGILLSKQVFQYVSPFSCAWRISPPPRPSLALISICSVRLLV